MMMNKIKNKMFYNNSQEIQNKSNQKLSFMNQKNKKAHN